MLANHTRGLDAYLHRQAERLEDRQRHLLSESAAVSLPPGIDLANLTTSDLKNICRQRGLKGWSKLRRVDLLTFLEQHLGSEMEGVGGLQQEQEAPRVMSFPGDASRTERLLLLLLRRLGTTEADVDAAWLGLP
ncbi:MAG: hypothetical protein WBN89_16710 [Prochlorococcaceae cyanobacterium]